MPIRMVDDENDNYSNENERTPGGGNRVGGGGNLILQFLPMIIGLLIRKPALLLVVLAAAAFMYFSGGGCNMNALSNGVQEYATGGNLNKDSFAKANVYEGLDESKNDLPEFVSLLKYAPERLNQGQQGSCVAWSSAYAARTIIEAATTGANANAAAFSPAFMYNQIGLDGCQGSYLIRAMKNLTEVGAVPFNDFPYTDKDCERKPDYNLIEAAANKRMLGYTRLTSDETTRNIDLYAIKQHLAKDVPVVIGMMVGGSFMQEMQGKEVWNPREDDYTMMGFGGHAMCVIGYDDRKEGGAFQIMNSWGKDWGNNGIAWILYKDFKHFVKEAYGLDPMPKKGDANATNLALEIGLVEAKTKQCIALQNNNENNFTTTAPIKKGTTFKVEVKNNTACYVYIIGKETDGSSYVLFPYPSKKDPTKTIFSPYFGITGYRLFPRGKSLMADDFGTQDQIAIVTSLQPLNVFELNESINSNKYLGFENAVNKVVNKFNNKVKYSATSSGTIAWNTAIENEKAMVACIVTIDKN